MTEDDIHAFPQQRAAVPPAAPAPRGAVWPWVLLILVVLTALLAASGASVLMALLQHAGDGVDITINGERWDGLGSAGEHPGLAFVGIAAGLLAVLVVVPLAVLVSLLAAALGIGVALLALLAVTAVALSPLWLIVLLLWLVLRRPRPATATMRE